MWWCLQFPWNISNLVPRCSAPVTTLLGCCSSGFFLAATFPVVIGQIGKVRRCRMILLRDEGTHMMWRYPALEMQILVLKQTRLNFTNYIQRKRTQQMQTELSTSSSTALRNKKLRFSMNFQTHIPPDGEKAVSANVDCNPHGAGVPNHYSTPNADPPVAAVI